jgi:hypothetical protein
MYIKKIILKDFRNYEEEELIFDETTSRPIILRGMVERNLSFMRQHNKEKYPKLIEMNEDRSYLTYSL